MLASSTMLPTCKTMPPRISRVDPAGQVDLLLGLPLDLLADLGHDSRVQLDRAGHRHVDPPVLLLPQVLEVAADAEDLRRPVLLDQQLEEVDQLGVGAR